MDWTYVVGLVAVTVASVLLSVAHPSPRYPEEDDVSLNDREGKTDLPPGVVVEDIPGEGVWNVWLVCEGARVGYMKKPQTPMPYLPPGKHLAKFQYETGGWWFVYRTDLVNPKDVETVIKYQAPNPEVDASVWGPALGRMLGFMYPGVEGHTENSYLVQWWLSKGGTTTRIYLYGETVLFRKDTGPKLMKQFSRIQEAVWGRDPTLNVEMDFSATPEAEMARMKASVAAIFAGFGQED